MAIQRMNHATVCTPLQLDTTKQSEQSIKPHQTYSPHALQNRMSAINYPAANKTVPKLDSASVHSLRSQRLHSGLKGISPRGFLEAEFMDKKQLADPTWRRLVIIDSKFNLKHAANFESDLAFALLQHMSGTSEPASHFQQIVINITDHYKALCVQLFEDFTDHQGQINLTRLNSESAVMAKKILQELEVVFGTCRTVQDIKNSFERLKSQNYDDSGQFCFNFSSHFTVQNRVGSIIYRDFIHEIGCGPTPNSATDIQALHQDKPAEFYKSRRVIIGSKDTNSSTQSMDRYQQNSLTNILGIRQMSNEISSVFPQQLITDQTHDCGGRVWLVKTKPHYLPGIADTSGSVYRTLQLFDVLAANHASLFQHSALSSVESIRDLYKNLFMADLVNAGHHSWYECLAAADYLKNQYTNYDPSAPEHLPDSFNYLEGLHPLLLQNNNALNKVLRSYDLLNFN